jgi:hypothetical protein
MKFYSPFLISQATCSLIRMNGKMGSENHSFPPCFGLEHRISANGVVALAGRLPTARQRGWVRLRGKEGRMMIEV